MINVFLITWQNLRPLKWHPFYNRRRQIVRLFNIYRKNPSHPTAWILDGVPETDFRKHALLTPIVLKMRGYTWPSKFDWLTLDNVIQYTNYAKEEGLLQEVLVGRVKLTSKGEQYASRLYYPKKLFGLILPILVPFVSIPILAFIVVKAAFFFGFRIDSASLYGITAKRGPELSYSYDKAVDGFVVTWQPGIEIEQLDWFLAKNGGGANIKRSQEVNPFVITRKDIATNFLNWAIDVATHASPSLSYSRNEILAGIECKVLPEVAEQGIALATKTRYLNKDSSEVHEIKDLIRIKGFGGTAPTLSMVEDNVTQERWDTFFDKRDEYLESQVRSLVENRRKYKDEAGNCLERGYLLEWSRTP